MSKNYHNLILGGDKNTSKWTKGSELYQSVSMVLEWEKNIFIKGVKLLKYSMTAFQILMDSEDAEDTTTLHALFEFDLGYISVPPRKFEKVKNLFN